ATNQCGPHHFIQCAFAASILRERIRGTSDLLKWGNSSEVSCQEQYKGCKPGSRHLPNAIDPIASQAMPGRWIAPLALPVCFVPITWAAGPGWHELGRWPITEPG